jgi:hypothetical protein
MPARQPINTPQPTPKKQTGFWAFLSNIFRRKPKNDWMNTINQDGTTNTASDDFMRANNVNGTRQG